MNVSHHYDISDDLYDLFLDSKRQYSCAYFKNDNDTLEVAQNNKIQHIIKKLNIKDNQKVLDIGCGWGSLAIDIAKSANCEVTGITLSENQLKYCKNKAKELNLKVPDVSWHSIRDNFCETTGWLALVGSSLGKIAYDIMLMMQTEIQEVSEPFLHGRGSFEGVRKMSGCYINKEDFDSTCIINGII